jgi:hypothetical protein
VLDLSGRSVEEEGPGARSLILVSNYLDFLNITHTSSSVRGCLIVPHGQFLLFDFHGTDSWIVAFIGVRCFRSTSLKDVYLLNVGGKAVETLVTFTLDTIMFKGEVDFHKCTANYAIDVVGFNKVAVEVGSQGLDVMCTFNFA